MRKFVVFLVVAVVGVGVPTTAASAASSAVSITACGQVITADAVLHQNLTCAGTALVVGASGVDVRLGGHTIRSADGKGTGVEFGVSGLPYPGVQDVTVRGGTIEGFANAIADTNAGAGNQVDGLALVDNTWGISWQAPTLGVHHTTITGPNGIGPWAYMDYSMGQVAVDHSTISLTGEGGYSLASVDATIATSRIDGGQVFTPGGTVEFNHDQLMGVSDRCGDANFVVTDSRVFGGQLSGIDGLCWMDLSGNRFVGPGTGTAVVVPSFSAAAVVTGNVFTGWGTAVTMPGYAPITLTDNVFRGNGAGFVGTNTGGGTATDNQFLDNAGVGLSVSQGPWTIGSNTALRNGGWGIDAEAGPPPSYGPAFGLTDLGGDVARANQPPQCIGVVCTSH